MTDGAFGKKARKIQKRWRDTLYPHGPLEFKCWPEIIQLYEAAQLQHDLGEARPALCAALSALDKKAEEVRSES